MLLNREKGVHEALLIFGLGCKNEQHKPNIKQG